MNSAASVDLTFSYVDFMDYEAENCRHRNMMASSKKLAVGLFCCVASFASAGEEFTSAQQDFFERRIRPILVDHCQECHNVRTSESNLRLDSRESVLKGGDRGPAVSPGNAEQSLLVRAVTYVDSELEMPPSGKLESNQIADLKRWIQQGAAWPDEPAAADVERVDPGTHWAFRPIARPKLPTVNDPSWPQNAIDFFVLSKLEEVGLEPSPRADLEVLARRAYLDLWGLPPRYETVSSFANSNVHGAFDRLVQRLLANRHYGERWARHWLDVARYGDTKGYVDGGQRRFAFAYTYRDYVIRALNEDLPYDEFVRDQIAADMVGHTGNDQWRLAGMGLLTVGRRFNHNFHDTVDDQIDVISRGLQGLTVSCARCHDHKFDPISAADYYALHGILANSDEPPHSALPILNDYQESDSSAHLAELNKSAAEYDREYSELHEKIQHEMRAYAGDYLVYLVRESPRHRDGAENRLFTDRVVLRGPSAYGYGAIWRWRKYINSCDESHPVFGIWQRLNDIETDKFAEELTSLLANDAFNSRLRQALATAQPINMVQLGRAYGSTLEGCYADWQKHLAENPNVNALKDESLEQIRQVLYGKGAPPVMTRFESIDCYHLDEHTHMRNLAGKIEECSLKADAPAPRAMILRDRVPRYKPVVFLRGHPNRPGQKVLEGIPNVFSVIDNGGKFRGAEGTTRLALAEAIMDRHNPLTARVFVNRVWHWHFGQPLVATLSDFGVRSKPPTHPELLDYLAGWFMDSGWSVKRLHHHIMSSSTYQQASQPRRDGQSIDGENRLLWRYRSRRLEWEAIRDSLLFVAGRMQNPTGGPPIETDSDARESVCRTIYLLVDRQHVPRFARNFDFPAPDFTVPNRPITTVPQQQLFFLNSPFVQRQAEELGGWVLKLSISEEERFRALHRRVFAAESILCDAEIHESLNTLKSADGKLWTLVAHAMLQSNAFVMIE